MEPCGPEPGQRHPPPTTLWSHPAVRPSRVNLRPTRARPARGQGIQAPPTHTPTPGRARTRHARRPQPGRMTRPGGPDPGPPPLDVCRDRDNPPNANARHGAGHMGTKLDYMLSLTSADNSVSPQPPWLSHFPSNWSRRADTARTRTNLLPRHRQ